MALLDRKTQGSDRDLKVFGFILLVFGAIVAALVYFFAGSAFAAAVIAAVTLVLTLIYYAVVPLRPLVYAAWMAIFFPIGWLISHTLLAITYFGVITPIGLIMRLFGYDPLKKKLEPGQTSHWSAYANDRDTRRYFQQF